MVIASPFDALTTRSKRQTPPIRVGVGGGGGGGGGANQQDRNFDSGTSSTTTKFVVGGIFAAIALVVCGVTIYLWLKHRRRVNFKTAKFNEAAGQSWKLDDQLPPNPTPGDTVSKPSGYGGKGGHDAGPEQELGLLAHAADPGHGGPGPSSSGLMPYSHSNSSFHSAASTPPPGRYSYDSKGQRLSSAQHDHDGQPCPVHSRPSSNSGLRSSSYITPPPAASTYNTSGAPPTNPNFYAAQPAQTQPGARPQSIPRIHSPPPQYMSRPGTAQQTYATTGNAAPTPAALLAGPPTSQRPQHQFSNPYNHHRRPSATNQLLPLYLANNSNNNNNNTAAPGGGGGGGGLADSYFDAATQLETPVVMQAQAGRAGQRGRELSVDGRGRERERESDSGPFLGSGHERGLSVDTIVPSTPGGGRGRERRLSIGVPVIARTRSGRRQASVDTVGMGRRTAAAAATAPLWADERGRLSVLQAEGVGRDSAGGRPRGRSFSPARHSFELDGGGADVGDSLLGRQYRAWGKDQVGR